MVSGFVGISAVYMICCAPRTLPCGTLERVFIKLRDKSYICKIQLHKDFFIISKVEYC